MNRNQFDPVLAATFRPFDRVWRITQLAVSVDSRNHGDSPLKKMKKIDRNQMKSTASKLGRLLPTNALAVAALVAMPMLNAKAADIHWTGGTADYTNVTDWAGGAVPGFADNAINDNGTGNVVQINVGDGDWTVNQIRAGNGAGSGAFTQNGQNVNLTGTNLNGSVVTVYNAPFRLGVADGDTGVYTLNGGSINYSNGIFNVGELGTGILNIYGGSITGSGNFADNIGTHATPVAVTATVGNGLTEGDFTWFEQGYYAANPGIGLPAAGSTNISLSQADHSYAFASSYTANNAVIISANLTSATITPTTPPVPCSGLSFEGSAGNGPANVNYTVHHADGTNETGSLSVPDWFASGQEVMAVGGRVDALGINFNIPGAAPYLWSLDIPVTDTNSAVTSIDLTYASGGVACLMGVSSQATNGGEFTPMTMTGYNKDVVVEAGAVSYVSGSVTDIVNQTNGAINVTGGGQLFVGNFGVGVYNLSGGSVDVHNYIAIGRSSGNGTFNMTGGTLNQDGGGNLLVGTGFNNLNGPPAVGVLNQSGGTINSVGQFLCPENSPSSGTYNMSGTAVLNVNNWLAIGRNSGSGVLNLTNGIIVKTGTAGDHITIGSGGSGVLNQYGGAITNTIRSFFLGESASGTWNFNGGTAVLANVVMCVNNSAGIAALNLNGGLFQASGISSPTYPATSTTLSLNGATVQANANNAAFISSLSSATVGPGSVIDSQGYNIAIPQELDDNGGGTITKNGSGTLTLTGANNYTGATTVNAGTLITGTSSSASAATGVTIATNAGFGVVVQAANAQYTVSSVSLGAPSTASTLDFDLGAFGNPAKAPLNITGTFTANGTITVNVAASVVAIGTIPLVHYGALAGSPTYVLGSLPAGAVAHLTTITNTLELVVTSAGAPRWDGNVTGTWDFGTNQDWFDLGTLVLTTYSDGKPIVFNDDAAGTTTVNLTATVAPASVNFNNSVLPYSIVGPGRITGNIGLNVNSNGTTVSILNTGGNSYTGPTVISGGTLIVTNLANGTLPSPIGASSADPSNLVVQSGATFSYTGSALSVNRGYTIQGGGTLNPNGGDLTVSGIAAIQGVATINANGNLILSGAATASSSARLVKTGAATVSYTGRVSNQVSGTGSAPGVSVVAGTLLFDGTAGNQTNHITSETWVGSTPASGGSIICS